MRHKIIERLVEKVQEIRQAHPDRAIAHYRTKGRRVWSVEYDTYCWFLYHHNILILSYNEQTGKVNERLDLISVSDQHGMNGFLSALGVNYYVRRAGRTARYV